MTGDIMSAHELLRISDLLDQSMRENPPHPTAFYPRPPAGYWWYWLVTREAERSPLRTCDNMTHCRS